ncbi:MAG: endonuclease [Myxococcales bacterium]|nr:endonuclease [Myxococcales bacterium]
MSRSTAVRTLVLLTFAGLTFAAGCGEDPAPSPGGGDTSTSSDTSRQDATVADTSEDIAVGEEDVAEVSDVAVEEVESDVAEPEVVEDLTADAAVSDAAGIDLSADQEGEVDVWFDPTACDGLAAWLRENGGSCVNDIPFGDESGDDLRRSISRVRSQSHIEYQYQDAREQMFEVIDNEDGIITGVYTGFQIESLVEPDATVMNSEHTWPRSRGAEVEPMESDIHHLFPAEPLANNQRGSLFFCEVATGVEWTQGGSSRGDDADGQECFEPRDEHKGQVARALFYFATAYGTHIDPD